MVDLLTITEACEALRTTPRRLRAWLKDHPLMSLVKLGGEAPRLFPRSGESYETCDRATVGAQPRDVG
jgi:hypothetical protein